MSDNIVANRETNVITTKEDNSNAGNIFGKFNKIFVSGRIEEEFKYSHQILWENFYETRVIVTRNSGIEDFIPIVISEKLMPKNFLNESFIDKWVEVAGQFRSYNKEGENGKKHLKLFLFVTAINIYEDEDGIEEATDANLIYLDGYICKPPIFRKTPLGREIADLLIAVNRNYGKSDYIPCIAWGRNAKWASYLEVGSRIELYGRVQSREYFKKFSPQSEAGEWRVVYEISVMRLQEVTDSRLEG